MTAAKKTNTIIPLFIPFAGCAHRCVYCAQPEITGAAAEVNPKAQGEAAGRMLRDLDRSRAGKVEAAFYGGSFTALPRETQAELLGQLSPLLASGEIDGIRLSTRPDCIDGEGLDFLRQRGVTTIELGVQSMDEEVLRRAGRGHTAEDSRRAARLVRGRGISLGLQMMTALPGDTVGSTVRTALEIAELGPDMVRIYPALVIEGTPLARMWQRGEYRPWGLEETLEVLALIIPLFRSRGIDIGRIGLLPDKELLESSRVLAGPWHPSLGWMAQSLMMRRRLEEWLPWQRKVKAVRVNGRDLSACLGEGRRNLSWFREISGRTDLEITADPTVPPGWFAAVTDDSG